MKKVIIVVGIFAIILTILLIYQGNSPEFFDIFGFVIFLYLIGLGIYMLKKNKKPEWISLTILEIGILVSSVAEEVGMALERKVEEILRDAIKRAKANNRRTIQARDL